MVHSMPEIITGYLTGTRRTEPRVDHLSLKRPQQWVTQKDTQSRIMNPMVLWVATYFLNKNRLLTDKTSRRGVGSPVSTLRGFLFH